MSKCDPPRLAVWLLDRLSSSGTKDALTGDLIESFHAGRSRGWFWKQAGIAIISSASTDVRRHWPALAYALSTPVMDLFLWSIFRATRTNIPWHVLPWPLSQLVFEQTPAVLLPIAALPVLGTALILNKSFRWLSLFRTAMFGLVFSAIAHFLLLSVALPEAVYWPPGGWPIPAVLTSLVLMLTFWLSARLGCRPSRSVRSLA
jgi:hypothetical protein